MHRLRHARTLTQLLLLWFVCAFGVTLASPWVAPQALQLVCSANGALKLLPLADGEAVPDKAAAEGGAHSLDCPLCSLPGLSDWPRPTVPGLAPPLSYQARSIPAARMAALTAAPLPPRGPPASA
ncbi:hypothetical protein PSQ20_04965 [Curvibacter sp. RS43]|uniref:DUF2946 domain-containing protein n=1 Tax=Curvibacter microcysteis TaxID=3026419 RepID=A0ABT5ME48_9BURK|nr:MULTISPECIES: DUF2946 family protein [unclassified Curvibacter]MDD0809675.1 hypothetical protein [Curvibacter sp. RS43]MDD0814853.1 hypothetical protein [Curvibacter sp. HBC28]